MPLRDHFHPPLKDLRHWESFHAAWANNIMRTLNRRVLPKSCFAETQVHVGSQVEIDIATFERTSANGEHGGVTLATWAPPAVAAVIPTVFPDVFEVQVIRDVGGPHLVGAIELVSPSNKDRPETRRAFVAKCAAYLQQGIGLVVVDVVTERKANLHNQLVQSLKNSSKGKMPAATYLYTSAYRPSRTEHGDQIEIWTEPLRLGKTLPTMPLALLGIGMVPVDLNTTYQLTCEDSRLP